MLLGHITAEPTPAVSANPLTLAARSLEKRHDCHGSGFCGSAGKQQIGNAITAMSVRSLFSPYHRNHIAETKQGFLGDERDKVHKAYTAHAKKSSDNYGMTAMFVCNSADDYENSQWTGQDVFNGMISVYTGAHIAAAR
ncbi:MAG: hypothetical protein LQ339_005665 [Xanthoria mediterranea]|nr:MAG: hypothetical protein LQ339_005665 [Xanthoria mediterranea]